jgi:hypothetical protein
VRAIETSQASGGSEIELIAADCLDRSNHPRYAALPNQSPMSAIIANIRIPLAALLLLGISACSSREIVQGDGTPTASIEDVAAPRIGCESILASLIDPAKLDTLRGDRAANSRLRKISYWIAFDRAQGGDPAQLIGNAQALANYGGTARACEDKEALLRNLTILERLGCLNPASMEALRQGKAPTISRGPYAGDIAAVDHIIPRSVTPELDEKLYNLEFMPASMNRKKSASIGLRQRSLATKWAAQGLLSSEGAAAVAKSSRE